MNNAKKDATDSSSLKSNVAIALIRATFNNTHISVHTLSGAVIAWSSSGQCGFKGSKKSTPYAGAVAAENVSKKAIAKGIKTVGIILKGPGAGRESAVKAIHESGLKITFLKDVTSLPHNGCRSKKKRRI
ncbi:30S ribosomal protein S11 [Candidatus Deianiraea vastatrix]|uniref:Small ribosomal subunit protein uS11 n=1 Tax=Candidatus Deianiraea vastatrix TaxID=2163644 RepID=A0A5B8XCX2_9RICK|nr:30S ribosomal protein S11 [Candidatus Deianiraea vastatrix]QED23208.1 30S ribosomal protein S11 [Candidatus Deianiraea vastatrix]